MSVMERVKGKGHFYLTSVVPLVLQLRKTVINGSRRCTHYPLCLCQCSVLRVFKAIATRIRGKSKQTLKPLKIEPRTSRSESRALANWATTAPSNLKRAEEEAKIQVMPVAGTSRYLATLFLASQTSSLFVNMWFALLFKIQKIFR